MPEFPYCLERTVLIGAEPEVGAEPLTEDRARPAVVSVALPFCWEIHWAAENGIRSPSFGIWVPSFSGRPPVAMVLFGTGMYGAS